MKLRGLSPAGPDGADIGINLVARRPRSERSPSKGEITSSWVVLSSQCSVFGGLWRRVGEHCSPQ